MNINELFDILFNDNFDVQFINSGDIVAHKVTLPKLRRKKVDLGIEKVIYNKPATIIRWKDGTKTVVKCDEHDTYDAEKGLLIAILKKMCGNKGAFYHDAIVPWLPEKEENDKR